jgi:hypothetical protein
MKNTNKCNKVAYKLFKLLRFRDNLIPAFLTTLIE